jgi:two-component system response regulator FlrC
LVLIVEDEQSIRDVLVELFEIEGTVTRSAGTLDDALVALADTPYHLVVTDIRLGGHRNGGLQVMAAAGILAPDAAVIVLTAYPDESNRHASLRLGATHFLEKPVPLATIAELAARHGVPTAIYPVVNDPALAADEGADDAEGSDDGRIAQTA